MAPDPLQAFERWIDRDEFSVRREVRLQATQRRFTPPRLKVFQFLQSLGFEGAHAWPLRWGGPEVTQGVFWAHKTINKEFQSRIEHALGRRMAKRLEGTGIKLFVTVAARRYPQLHLLESVTYKLEAVTTVGNVTATNLGEVTISQNLSDAERHALVRREKIPIDAKRLGSFEGEILTHRLDNLVEGLRRVRGSGSRSAADAATVRSPPDAPPGDSKGLGNRGTGSRLTPATRPRTLSGRLVVRGAKMAGRLVLKTAAGAVSTILEATLIADKMADQFRSDLSAAMQSIGPLIEEHKQAELQKVENINRFEAAPFDQFWFRVRLRRDVIIRGSIPRLNVHFVDVIIVNSPGVSACSPSGTGNLQVCVAYDPIFEKLTYGEELAAKGYPLRVIERSHGTSKGEQRLQVIRDYIAFAKEYTQLAELYTQAWRDHRKELCIAGVAEFFSESEIEECKWQKHLDDLSRARGTTRLDLLRPASDASQGVDAAEAPVRR